jgi:hypothetical protein
MLALAEEPVAFSQLFGIRELSTGRVELIVW